MAVRERRPDFQAIICDDGRDPLLKRSAVHRIPRPDHAPSATGYRLRVAALP